MRHLAFLPLLALAACVNAGVGTCGDTITVFTAFTTNEDGSVDNEQCFTETSPNHYDMSGCCPEGYVFVGMASASEVICEYDCKLAAVSSVQDEVYVIHGVADALQDTVESRYTPGPPPGP